MTEIRAICRYHHPMVDATVNANRSLLGGGGGMAPSTGLPDLNCWALVGLNGCETVKDRRGSSCPRVM